MIEFVGSAGNMTGYKGRDGRNVIRKRTWNRRNPKTPLQMRRRVQWPNLVQTWKAILPFMHPSFETKAVGQTDFNAFMQANLDSNCVFLTAQESRLGVCVAAPYEITRGTLPTIVSSIVSGGKVSSDIALGDLVIGDETTVAALSRAIVENNSGWEYGDQLSFIYVQQVNEGVALQTSIPKVKVSFSKVILSTTNNTLLTDIEGGNFGFGAANGYLATSRQTAGFVAYIHSRLENGKTLVSSARLAGDNQSMLTTYGSREAQLAAIKSYKGAAAKALTPLTDEYLAASI